MAGETATFTVEGLQPKGDPFWIVAGAAVRREFWRRVVVLVKDANRHDRLIGIGRRGGALRNITPTTRKLRRPWTGQADPSAPPLIPGNEGSRTIAFFDGRAFEDRAEFLWRKGWGRIVSYHRRGAWNHWSRRRLPERDVVGLSPNARRRIKRSLDRWWKDRKKGFIR